MEHTVTPQTLRKLRDRLELTQKQLAEELGVSECTIGRRECGRLPFKRESVLACLYLLTQRNSSA